MAKNRNAKGRSLFFTRSWSFVENVEMKPKKAASSRPCTRCTKSCSWDEALSDGKWAAEAEGARGDFKAGSGLFALVFVAVDEHGDVSNELQIVAKVLGNLHGCFHFFDIGLQNAVQHFVRRQRVRVLLIWTQLGAGGFLDSRAGNQFPLAIYVFGELVDHELGNIGNDGEAAGHVAVQRAVAHGDFGFVAGAEDHGTEFVGKSHQVVAADAGLDIFLGRVHRAIAEAGFEGLDVGIEYRGDGDSEEFDP